MATSSDKRLPRNANKCDPCDYDGALEEASAFCIDCVEYLCSNCLGHHRKIKATREHNVLTQEFIPEKKTAFEKMQSVMKCSTHREFDVRCKCEDHNLYACVICERIDHVSCNKLFLFDISNEKVELGKEKIRERISEIRLHKNRTVLDELKDSISFLSNEKTRIIQQREKLVQKLESALKQLKGKLSEFQIEAQKATKNLKRKKGELVKACMIGNEEELFLKTVLDYGSPNQQFMVANEINRPKSHDLQIEDHMRYRIENTLDSQIRNLIESLSTMNWEIVVTEDVTTAPERLLSKCSDFVEDGFSISTAIAVRDKSGSNENFDSCAAKLKTSKQKNRKESSSSTGAPPNILSVVMKGVHVDNEEMSEWECKNFTEVLLHGTPHKKDKVDVTVTQNEVFIVTLRDARVVLLLNEKLQVFETLKLDANPLGICSIEATRVAILCSDQIVRKFQIFKKYARKFNDFNVNEFCTNIAKYGDTGIVVLYTTGPSQSTRSNKRLMTYLEIRDHFSGRVLKKIQINMVPENIENLLIYSPKLDRIVISDDKVLRLFSESGDECGVFTSPGINAITGNRNGKIYIHSHVNNSIVATSENKTGAEVYYAVTKFRSSAISYSEKNRRLVILGLKAI